MYEIHCTRNFLYCPAIILFVLYTTRMQIGLTFAILGAIAFGLWTVFHQQASAHINNLLASILVSLTAVIVGLLFFIPQMGATKIQMESKGLIFAILGGICALGIDYFALRAYGSGLPISVAGPIIIGGSIAVATVIGFFLGESLTIAKIAALILVILGSTILSALGK